MCDFVGVRFTAAIAHEGEWFAARALEVEVTTQDHSSDEAPANLRRALRRPSQRGERRAGSREGKWREVGKMSARDWEKEVLATKCAEKRVAEIERELLLASRLTALREGAGVSQRELAKRLGVSQPRVAAIERSHNMTIEVLEQYVEALGAMLEVNVLKGRRKTRLLGTGNEGAESA